MRYFIKLSFNGAPFSGWQIQKNAVSIQEELQKALSLLLKEDVVITGAGRTDAQVNAINYVAHTDLHSAILLKRENRRALCFKLCAILPREIQVHGIYPMPPSAHARFDAISRTYNYFLTLAPDPFNTNFALFYKKGKLNFDAMNEGAKNFIGTHDFSSLQKVGSQNKTSVCTVTEALWKRAPRPLPFNTINRGSLWVFTVTADRFLRNMVRAMVGSLIEVGSGKQSPEWIGEMLSKKNRCEAGESVPGRALFLCDIKYPYRINR